MFDTMLVAQKIKEARIAQNLTQMNLADAMDVSYQAVSNWERGNSMPDIAKLGQLAEILQVSIDNLLGRSLASTAVSKTLSHEDSLTIEEISAIAPLLPPKDIETYANDAYPTSINNLDIETLISLAPFLSGEQLRKYLPFVSSCTLSDINALAPFLSCSDDVKYLITKLDLSPNQFTVSDLINLAPFLESSPLGDLVTAANLSDVTIEDIIALGPFVESEILSALVEKADTSSVDFSVLTGLAPFITPDALSTLTLQIVTRSRPTAAELLALAPFLPSTTVEKVLDYTMGNTEALQD